MKFFFTALLFLASLSAMAYFFWYKPKFVKNNKVEKFIVKKEGTGAETLKRLQQKAASIITYAKTNGCNTQYSFLIDMKVASGKNRFFVYNLQKDSVEVSGLVTHGSGKTNNENIQFSNIEGSLCTSLGKYKIGNPYMGKFGLAFKLYGLDNTNSNAYNRFVVLHSHECVPNTEVAPLSICESWGCPTVAPDFLTAIQPYIKKAGKPILLYIYN